MAHLQSNKFLAAKAFMDTLPLCIAVIPWGILTGAIAIQIGMSPLQAQLMSLLVFAGAAQLSGMTMMANATPLLPLFASTFVISSRHLLYSVVFRQHVIHLPLHRRLLMGFVLTDEMFAVSEAHTKLSGYFSEIFALVSGFSFYVIWNLATAAGILAGEYFGNLESLGFDFAIAATFIAMTFTDLRRVPVLVAIIVSGVLSVLLKPYFNDSYIIIAALLGMLAAYIFSEPSDEPNDGEKPRQAPDVMISQNSASGVKT
jgi:4-azaleucine resistance transporter AzlC